MPIAGTFTEKTQILLTGGYGDSTAAGTFLVKKVGDSLVITRYKIANPKTLTVCFEIFLDAGGLNTALQSSIPIFIDTYLNGAYKSTTQLYSMNAASKNNPNILNYAYAYIASSPTDITKEDTLTFFLKTYSNYSPLNFYLSRLLVNMYNGDNANPAANPNTQPGAVWKLTGNENKQSTKTGTNYYVYIDNFNQETYYKLEDYFFSFNLTIEKGTSTEVVPFSPTGEVTSRVFVREVSSAGVVDKTGLSAPDIWFNTTDSGNYYYHLQNSPQYTWNFPSEKFGATPITGNKILKANTKYALYVGTYYLFTGYSNKVKYNNYIESNYIEFTTPDYANSLVKINTGYYFNNSNNKYFNIEGTDPNQTITNATNILIPYSNNIITTGDNSKRSITLNGSYFFIRTSTSTYIESTWFNFIKPSQKPSSIGFIYMSSATVPTLTNLVNNGNMIAIDPFIIDPNPRVDVKSGGPDDFRSCAFSTTITDLSIKTTYYFVSFLKKTDGTYVYGNVEKFTTLAQNETSFQNPNFSGGQNWYQIYDNWKLVENSTNSINPHYKLDSSLKDDNREFPLFYYFDATFKKEKNYQFRTIVENFYDKEGSYDLVGSGQTNFSIKTPWGENHKFPVPYIKDSLPFKTINLFLYSNINSINIANKPINNITSKSGGNPKNPITYIANGKFNYNPTSQIPSQGLIYTNVNDTDWILQGYAFFNFFKPTKKNTNNTSFNSPDGLNVNNMVFDGNDEVIYTNSNNSIGGKGWHLIEKKNQLIWFDKYVPSSIDTLENTKNLPVGGNSDDYYSSKTSDEKWRQNNYVAKYIPYQSFNVSFNYSNNSNSILEMYVGSKLPKYENGDINYFDDYKKIATFDKNSPSNCEFVGLEGNQYIYFVATPLNYGSLSSVTYSLIYLSNFKFGGSYNSGNNLEYNITSNNNILSTTNPIDNATYSIKLGNYNNVDLDVNKYADPIILNSNAGNGTFNAGIWENGVWNNGWRKDLTKKDFFNIDQYFSYESDKKWRIKISGPESSVYKFSVGDKVAISNIVAIDINDERKLLKNYYTIIEVNIVSSYISVEFESDFPLRRIEMDSDEHRICITKNVWLSGVFLNGYFNGIWNNGLFSGYPLITKMDNSHWLDGIFNGGHFTARKYSIDFQYIGSSINKDDNLKMLKLIFSKPHMLNKGDLILLYDGDDNLIDSTIILLAIDEYELMTGITWENITKFSNFNNLTNGVVYSLISTGLAQNMEFYSNNVSSATSLVSLDSERIFSYNSWLDVNYSIESAVNIGKPYYLLDKISNRSYSENNLYGYPTNDILSSNSTFRDSFSKNSRKYKLGKKWKIFNDYVGDSSTFEEYFQSTDVDSGLQLFNSLGWEINKLDVSKKNININGANSYKTTTKSYFAIYLNDKDYTNIINVGDIVNLNGWTTTDNAIESSASNITYNDLKVSYVIFNKTGPKLPPKIGYEELYLPDRDYTIISFDNFSTNLNNSTIIEKLATSSYFGPSNGTIGVLSSPGPAYNQVSVNTFTLDINKSKYVWSIDKNVSNSSLVFSRSPEPLDTTNSTIGKELKIDALSEGGILNLIPAYDINNRTNGGDVNTLEKSNYTLIEFDVLQNNSENNFYTDPNIGDIPIINFNNLNYITKNFSISGITYSRTTPSRYLPINSNINHLTTRGIKKQEFFYNKRNLLMNFKGGGLLGSLRSDILLDNIKLYQVDMIPFFQYFKYSNINTSVQIPSNGTSPTIEYADDNESNIKSDTNSVVTYFGNSLIASNVEVPQGINWVNDYGLTFSTI